MVTLVNGVLPLSVLREVPWSPGKYVRYDVLDSLIVLNKAFRARFGVNLDVNEGYRNLDTQKSYYKNPPSGVGTAAVPGTSNHGWGLAIDFGGLGGKTGIMYLWMRANASNYGWDNPLWAHDNSGVEEPWHWENAKAKNVIPDIIYTEENMPLSAEDLKEVHGIVYRLWREPEIKQIIRDAVLNEPVARDASGPTTFLQDTVNGTTAALATNAQIGALIAAFEAATHNSGLTKAEITAAAYAGAVQALNTTRLVVGTV